MIDRDWRDGVLDEKVLDNLRGIRREGVPSILHKVINSYLCNSPKLLQNVREALMKGDTAAMQFAVHSLSSSSATLGALRLSAFCRELEVMCRADSSDFAEELVSKIEAEFEAVRDALKDELRRCP